jgi:hypothetical protein
MDQSGRLGVAGAGRRAVGPRSRCHRRGFLSKTHRNVEPLDDAQDYARQRIGAVLGA